MRFLGGKWQKKKSSNDKGNRMSRFAPGRFPASSRRGIAALSHLAKFKVSHRNADGDSKSGVPAVIHVVPVVDVRNIDVISVIPVIRPGSGPWVNETNPITVVLKTRVSTGCLERKPIDSERMLRPKVSRVPVVWDSITAVAATLLPGAVV